MTGEIRQNRNISSLTTVSPAHHHHHHQQTAPGPSNNNARGTTQVLPSAVARLMLQTLRARKAHLVHTRQTQLIALHIAHQNRGLRQHQRRRILPRQTHRLCLQGTISPSTAILSAHPPLGLTLTAGATGNPGKQDPGYLGEGDEKSWKQRCCTSKVQE